MAISRTGGIQLSAEINNELSAGNNLGAYIGTHFLHVPSSTTRFIPTDRSISFSQLDGCSTLAEGTPVTPTIELLTQSNTNVQEDVSSTGTQLLSVKWKANHSTGMPVLLYTPVQNNPLPTTKWYEKIGSNWTLISGMSYSNAVGPSDVGGWFNIEVNSSIAVPLSTATTRTFKAVGYTFTSDGTTTKATNTQSLGSEFSITTTLGDAPTGSIAANSNDDSSGTVLNYTSGRESFFPDVELKFYYQGGFNTSPGALNGYVSTGNDTWTHVIYRSIDGAAESDVTSEFTVDPMVVPSLSTLSFTYLTKNQNYTTAGVYTYRLAVTLERNFTNPAGTAVTLTQSLPVGEYQVVTITAKTITDTVVVIPPVLISATINEDEVDEEGMFTLTIVTQHAIGKTVTISADEADVVPPIFATKLIENNSHSIVFGGAPPLSTIKKSNKTDDRTLTVTVTPVDDGINNWDDNTAVTDTILIKNTGEHEVYDESGVNISVVDEGGSFTFTLKGKNLRTTNYTWDTTFPSEAVTATSGSFSTPYAGGLYTGNYEGSFTVDTEERSTHYEDVTGGKISVYENDVLLTATAPTLQIKNTDAEPVTLPTATANPYHNVFRSVGHYGAPWSGSQNCSVTLGKDGTYTTSITPYSAEHVRNYATPQPLEGDWIPRITGAGDVSQFISQEDMYSEHYEHDPYSGLPDVGIYPGGHINANASFSGPTAILNIQGFVLTSSIASAACIFTWEFYNTSSEEIRAGGTITCNIEVSALPSSYIYPEVDPYALAKVTCATAGGTWNATTNSCDLPVIVVTVVPTVIDVTTGQTVVTNTDGSGTVIESTFLPEGQLITSYCDETTKMGIYADGIGDSYQAVIEFNSLSCGYEAGPAATTATAPTTGTTDHNIEIFVDADLQSLIQQHLDLIGALDLSDILSSIDLNLGI